MPGSNPFQPEEIAAFVASLRTADPTQFAGAVQQVADQAEVAVPQLLDALPGQSRPVQRRLVKLLADYNEKRRDARVIAPMLNLLTAEDPIIAGGAFRALAGFMDLLWPDALRLLPTCGALIKLQIVGALGSVNGSKLIPALIELLRQTQYPSLRYSLIE